MNKIDFFEVFMTIFTSVSVAIMMPLFAFLYTGIELFGIMALLVAAAVIVVIASHLLIQSRKP